MTPGRLPNSLPHRVPAQRGLLRQLAIIAYYWTLTKPEVNFLIIVTTGAGFYLASPGFSCRFLLFFNTLIGTLLVASGTGTLNQWTERHFDGRMRRTGRRPLPAGRVNPRHAFWFGISLSIGGCVYLALLVSPLASLIALVTLGTYLLIYTPLKRKTALCTLIGAFPGAAPPLIGWAAARGTLSAESWMLYAILFFWQFPHFMSIAWMYRQDYARAGYLTLPQGKNQGRFMAYQALLFSLPLIPLSILPAIEQQARLVYLLVPLLLSLVFSYYAACLAFKKTNANARRLLTASLVYLPVVFVLMMLSEKRGAY